MKREIERGVIKVIKVKEEKVESISGVSYYPKIAENSTSLQPHQKNSDAQNSRK